MGSLMRLTSSDLADCFSGYFHTRYFYYSILQEKEINETYGAFDILTCSHYKAYF